MPPIHSKWDITLSPAEKEALQRDIERFERAALEESSRQGLESTVRCYSIFCVNNGYRPFPVSYESLAAYCVQYCVRFGQTTRSLPTILSHLRRENRLHSPVWLDYLNEYRLADLISGLKKHDTTEVRRKLPMTHDVLDKLERATDMTKLLYRQHLTMARLAHDALLRGGELVKLRLCDLEWNADRTRVDITIHYSKCNKTAHPERVRLQDYGPRSATAHLRAYVDAMVGLKSHMPLWPTISLAGAVQPAKAVSKATFVAIARQLLTHAGFPASKYSGHSYRSGGATDLWDSNRCRPYAIKLHGRWKSDAYLLYIRDNPNRTATEVSHAFAFFGHTI